MKYYGVTQSHCGHEYRWIYEEETIKNHIGEIYTNECEDIRWPIGGSNSSATYIIALKNDEEARTFLTSKREPDLQDPTLVDIAEYLVSVEPEPDCCTKEFMDKFGLTGKDLEQYDDCYSHRSESERMIAEMLQYEENLPELASYHAIDRDNPFYGESRDVRYSELCAMYEEFLQKKERFNKEIKELEI